MGESKHKNKRSHFNEMTMDEALGDIINDPALRKKLDAMNEHEMRQNIKGEDGFDDDLDSISMDNDGIGSRNIDDTDSEDLDEDDDSEWDDIEEEEEKIIDVVVKKEEEYSLNAPPPKMRNTLNNTLEIDKNMDRRRFSSMKPRPNHEKVASGMSSVFLKMYTALKYCYYYNPMQQQGIKRNFASCLLSI